MIELVNETHSTTTHNEQGIATGRLPGELADLGRERARELGRRRTDDGGRTLVIAHSTARIGGRSSTSSHAKPLADVIEKLFEWQPGREHVLDERAVTIL